MSDKQKKSFYKKWWFWLIVIVFIVAIASQGGNDGKEEVASGNVSEQIENSVGVYSFLLNLYATTTNETLSQKNAVREAKQYLNVMAFSKEGLIKQLEFEGFSNEDATYAVNQIDVDWKEQAVKKAKEYLGIRVSAGTLSMAFSKEGLIKQLEFEGFSNEDATYAVNQIDVDWKEQAVKKVKEYLGVMAFSRKSLIEQLEFDGFTEEEATYAAEIAEGLYKWNFIRIK